MANTLRPYSTELRKVLNVAFCVQTFPCQKVERHNRPEIEYQEDPELIREPITVSRNEYEYSLIEPSINSVRVSLKLRQSDPLEESLTRKYLRFLMQRAESFEIVRKVPVEGFDVSFLITDKHCQRFHRKRLVDVICQFIEDTHAEISELKLTLKARNRTVVSEYIKSLVVKPSTAGDDDG